MYSPSKTISVKSGNTFSLFCSYFNDDGTALSLTDITITADIKTKSKTLITALVGAKNAPCNVQITKGKVYWLSSMVINSPAFSSNNRDFLRPIKGAISATQAQIIGYYTNGNTSMAQSAPTNKFDLLSGAPRVMFIVA